MCVILESDIERDAMASVSTFDVLAQGVIIFVKMKRCRSCCCLLIHLPLPLAAFVHELVI